jgi:hypothetical protein
MVHQEQLQYFQQLHLLEAAEAAHSKPQDYQAVQVEVEVEIMGVLM